MTSSIELATLYFHMNNVVSYECHVHLHIHIYPLVGHDPLGRTVQYLLFCVDLYMKTPEHGVGGWVLVTMSGC